MSRNVQMTRTPNRTPANRNNRNYTNVSLSPLSHRNQYISSPNLFDYSQETIGRSQVSQNFNHNSTSNSDDGNPRHRNERQRRPGERDDSQRYQGERDDSQRYQAERDEDHRNDLRDVSERDHTRALLGLDVMDDEDPDLQSGDDGITVSMQIPFDMTAREAQKILDKALHERLLRADGTPKRHYDGSKLDGLYSDGAKVWNAMIRTCRLQFSRYLTVPTTLIPEIIDSAVGSEVDRDSTAYSKSYTRILEWRKNWFSMYMKNVDTFQQKLESENFGYQHLTQEQLVTAYKKHFSFEAMYFLMGTMSSVVDWRATISQPAAKRLYKTIFTYSMVYSHSARHMPATLSRSQAMNRIRMMGKSGIFKDLGLGCLVLLPPKPPSKVRNMRTEVQDISELDPGFAAIDDEEEEVIPSTEM